ncbi:hypothetical protein NX059_004563 [Plenodomus lindquistii]|nr:hypothetical protein NX059_004563 [Plenodomus lindquistii]
MSLLNQVKAAANGARDALPSQREFLDNHLVPCTGEILIQAAGRECGVCLEGLAPVADWSGPTSHLPPPVVYLQPCAHFFHQSCIVQWHTGNRPERNTCPLCRCTLFIADPLTATQIRLLHPDRRPLEPYRVPGPDEELVSWDLYHRDMEASFAVNLEVDRAILNGGEHRWIHVSRTVRDNIMAAGGRIRPELEPHYDTTVLLGCAMSVLASVVRYRSAIRSPAFVSFNRFIDALMRGQEDPDIWADIQRNGLFRCNLRKVATVPKAYRQTRASWVRVASRLRDELAVARERRQLEGEGLTGREDEQE